MLACDECKTAENLRVCCNCKSAFCTRCLENNSCKLCGNNNLLEIQNKDFNGIRVNYIKLKDFELGISGFERINQDIVQVLNEIEKNKVVSRTKNILFPTKSKSIEFGKLFGSGLEGEHLKESKFTQVLIPYTGDAFTLFNLEKTKPNEISMLIELIRLKHETCDPLFLNQQTYIDFTNLIRSCLLIYNERMGINFVEFDETTSDLIKSFFSNLISGYGEYFAYKELASKYGFDILEYLEYKLNFEHQQFLKVTKEFKTLVFPVFFNIFYHLINTKALELSVIGESYHKRLQNKVQKYREETLSQLNSPQLSKLFEEFINAIDENNFITYSVFFNTIKSGLEKILLKTPLVIIRYTEAVNLMGEQIDLIKQEQNEIFIKSELGLKNEIMPYYPDFIRNLSKLTDITKRDIPPNIKIILLSAKIEIFQEFLRRNENKNLLNSFGKDIEEYSNLIIDNYQELKKDPFSSYYAEKWDIILKNNGLAEIYFMFDEDEKFKEIINKNRRLIVEHKAFLPLKISTLFLHFNVFEDYDDLREITKLCHIDRINEFSEKDEMKFMSDVALKTACEFSSYIIEGKGDLEDIIHDITEKPINVEPQGESYVLNEFFEKTGLLNWIKSIYHLTQAYLQKSDLLMLSELERSLEYTKYNYKINRGKFIDAYYLLKTECVINVLKNNKERIRNSISEFEDYESFKTSEAFTDILKIWLESDVDDELIRVELLSKIKEGYDPWYNLILKIIKKNIHFNVYEKIKNEVESIKKLSNLTEQLHVFKQIVEKDLLESFWKSRTKRKLQSRPESIGRDHLMAFLYGLDIYTHIKRETKEGVGNCDLLLISEKETSVIETKIVEKKGDIEEGIRELVYYTSKEGLDEGYLVLFDARKTKNVIDMEKHEDGKRIKITAINIYDEAPSKKLQ